MLSPKSFPPNYPQGFDAYHGDVLDIPELAKSKTFCFLKCSQGDGILDPAFEIRYRQALEEGILTAGYHYYDPDVSPDVNADTLISQLRTVNKGLSSSAPICRPALDVETVGWGMTDGVKTTLADDVNDCILRIKNTIGIYPWLYASEDFYADHLSTVTVCPIWVAAYTNVYPKLWTPNAIWQYVETAIDLDVYNGPLARFYQYHIWPIATRV